MKGSGIDGKQSLFQAFQIAVPVTDGSPEETRCTTIGSPSGVVSKSDGEQDATHPLEYGASSHVASVMLGTDDAKKRFLVKSWLPCWNDTEVLALIDKVSLSKSNRAKLISWTAHVQHWHQDLRHNVGHVKWTTMFRCRPVAGLVLEGFHPAQIPSSHALWGVMQRLLRYFRAAIIQDPHRLQAAVELILPTLAVGPPAIQELWLAALLTWLGVSIKCRVT